MRVLLSKFSEYACKLENGRHTLVGVFDDIRIPNLPLDHPPFFLCVQIELEPSETGRHIDLSCVFMDPDGGELFRVDTEGDLSKEPGIDPIRIFFLFPIQPIRLERAGVHRLDVLFNGQKVGEEIVPVLLVEAPVG
jgi:hypothetical protein